MGTFKVNGNIEATGNIIINTANNVDRFLHFDSTDSTGGYDWRIGYLGTGADNANYLVFQSTGNAGENWTSALRFGLNDLNATFAGSILPLTNNSKTIGSSSYKWNNIYATTFTGALSGTASKATNLTVADGSTDVERKILVTTEATSGQNTYCVPGVTANYIKKTLTAAGGFIGNLTGNATSASAAPWSGITGKPDYYPVRQSKSTASNYRPLLMHYVNGGYGADPGTSNAQVYYNETIAACPSTGAIAAKKFIGALQGNADTATTSTYLATSTGSDNTARHVYFAYNGDAVGKQRVVIDNNFKYNPSTNTLSVPNISGNASSASAAPWSGITGKPSLFQIYDRGAIGSSYNIDTMTINGLFEIRASSEVTISGTGAPTNSWYPCLSMYGSNCRMQIAGGNAHGFWIRGRQGPDPTLASHGWLKIQITQGYGSTLPSGSGYLAGTVFYKT